MFRIHHILSRC